MVRINIIMIEVDSFPLTELPSGRAFFKKGDFFSHFYFLEEGRVNVTISQVSIEVSAPIFLGDYEIIADLDQRTSSIKCITRCRMRTLPLELYPQISLHHESITAAFSKYALKTRLLLYWLKKLFIVGQYKRNDEVLCENALGVVLRGEFRLNSQIPIVRMKQPNFQLLRRFQICAIGEQELFEENVVCETHRGTAGVMEHRYTSQLSEHFEQFRAILGVASFKRRMHVNMTRQIALNCRKKRSLFQNMVPSTLKSSIKEEPSDRTHTTSVNKSELSKLATSQDVFSVKDNISQFLHKQWRRGLSLKLPKKQRRTLKLQTIGKKRVEDVSDPEMISLSIPREFKEVKFNFKMLLRTKENAQMRSRRVRTEPVDQRHPKLLFRD